MGSAERSSVVGRRLGGEKSAAWWDTLCAKYESVMPPYPAPPRFLTATMPAPPLIPGTFSLQEGEVETAVWYRATMHHFYPWTNAMPHTDSKSLSRRGDFAFLQEGAEFLRQKNVAPAAWFAYSVHVWHSLRTASVNTRMVPPAIKWVFAEKRTADDSLLWFRNLEAKWRGGLTYVTPAHRHAIEVWHLLVTRLSTGRHTVEEARELALVYTEEIASLGRQSQAQAHEIQRGWNDSLRDKVFLWV